MKTLFEELSEWVQCLRNQRPYPGTAEELLRNDVVSDITEMLDDHRESERWHYPAEGEVPKNEVTVLAQWELGSLWSSPSLLWRDGPKWESTETGDERTPPTRWRYLSPADVPEAE